MNPNFKATQLVAILAAVSPISASTAQHSAWVDATKFYTFLAQINWGVIQATGTIDAKIEQATDNAGTGAKDVAGKAITQITAGNNDQAEIGVRQEDLDFANGFNFIRLTVTPATAASLVSGLLVGLNPRYGAASDHVPASVVQTV